MTDYMHSHLHIIVLSWLFSWSVSQRTAISHLILADSLGRESQSSCFGWLSVMIFYFFLFLPLHLQMNDFWPFISIDKQVNNWHPSLVKLLCHVSWPQRVISSLYILLWSPSWKEPNWVTHLGRKNTSLSSLLAGHVLMSSFQRSLTP